MARRVSITTRLIVSKGRTSTYLRSQNESLADLRSSNGEVGLVADGGGSTQVCGDTDTFKNLSGGQEGVWPHQAKVVGALLDRGHTGLLECASQESDVVGFVLSNLREPQSDPVRAGVWREARKGTRRWERQTLSTPRFFPGSSNTTKRLTSCCL